MSFDSGPVFGTTEEVFAFYAETGRHCASINMLRDLLASDKTWADHVLAILDVEDDFSLLQLSLSDILAVDLSNLTEPSSRCAVKETRSTPALYSTACTNQTCRSHLPGWLR